MIADQLTHDRLTYRPDHLDIEMCRGVHGFAPQAPGSSQRPANSGGRTRCATKTVQPRTMAPATTI